MPRPRLDTVVVGLALVATAATAATLPLVYSVSHLRMVLLIESLALLVLLLVLVKVRADREAAGTQEDLRLLADNAGDLVLRVGPDGAVRFASPASRALCGRDPGALTGLPLADIVGPDDRAAVQTLLAIVARPGGPRRARVRVPHADGGDRWAEISARGSFDDAGRLREVHAALRDVTDRHADEQEILRRRDHAEALAARLERSRVALESQNEALRTLLTERACAQIRRETIFRIGRRLAGETAPDALARALLEGLGALTGARGGAVYAAPSGDGPLELVASRGVAGDVPGEAALPAEAGAMEQVPAGDGPLGAQGPSLLLPLRRAGVVVGAVWIAGADETPEGQAAEEVVDLARQAAVALDTARAFQAVLRQAGIVRAVLDSTPDAIHLVDPGGRTLMTNPPFRALSPLLGDGDPAGDALRVADPEGHRADLARIAADPDLQAVHEYTLADSDRTFVRYTSPVRDEAGGRVGRVFVHREVTAERASERLKDEFLALVSHELRTPLTSVLGYLEILLDGEAGPLTDEQEHVAGVAERNARRLRRLVGDLLVVAQAQAGRLVLLAEPVDLAEIARQCVEGAAPAAQERGVRLTGPAAGDRVDAVADPERMVQVVDNLLANAMTYTPPGGEVRVAVRRDASGVVLEVSDTGPGIAAGELERIFERFYRGASATRSGGAGLGLAISHAIVRAHHGEITAESAEGRGATFRVILPGAVRAGEAWLVDALDGGAAEPVPVAAAPSGGIPSTSGG